MSTAETDPRAAEDATPTTDHTTRIVEALKRAIVEHRLLPGAKLAEQKLADHFGVSRTLVRQALFQMARDRLIRLEPSRGAFVATPSAEEARQVFAVRRMLELGMVEELAARLTPADLHTLRQHVALEQQALAQQDVPRRTQLLADFHVRLAECLGNAVLAQILDELLSRCALITLMYQSGSHAAHSSDEHAAIVQALAAGDAPLARRLMAEHLDHVEQGLQYDRTPPTSDIALALS